MIRKNILSISFAVIISILSLTSAEKMRGLSSLSFHGADKLIHFIMYFGFMSVILFENRKRFQNPRVIMLVCLIPFFFGMMLEFLQSWITTSRSGSVYDLLFNLAGILFSVFIFLIARRFGNEEFK